MPESSSPPENLTSPCCGVAIDCSRGDGVTMGSCSKCGVAIIRVNPQTGAQEWLDGQSPWHRGDLRPVVSRTDPKPTSKPPIIPCERSFHGVCPPCWWDKSPEMWCDLCRLYRTHKRGEHADRQKGCYLCDCEAVTTAAPPAPPEAPISDGPRIPSKLKRKQLAKWCEARTVAEMNTFHTDDMADLLHSLDLAVQALLSAQVFLEHGVPLDGIRAKRIVGNVLALLEPPALDNLL